MRKFLLKILFLIPLVGFIAFVEIKLGQMPTSYSFKRESLEQQLDSIEVLVLGNSQVLYGVNPEFFDMYGYNLADVSQTIYYDKQLLLKYIDKMPNLKYLIVSVYYVSFGEQLYDGVEAWRDYCYSQFWDIDYYETGFFEAGRYSKIFLYTPKLSLYYLRTNFKTDVLTGFKQNGYKWHDTTLNRISITEPKALARVKEHDLCYNTNRIDEIVADFEMLIATAKLHYVEPIIITPPVHQNYSRHANCQIMSHSQKTISDICNKYQCRYLNFFYDNRFNDKDFFDNDHLNFRGAQKLSSYLNTELKSIQGQPMNKK